MIASLYQTLGITLHTVRTDYDCVWCFFLVYQALNRRIQSAALPYPCGALEYIVVHSTCEI